MKLVHTNTQEIIVKNGELFVHRRSIVKGITLGFASLGFLENERAIAQASGAVFLIRYLVVPAVVQLGSNVAARIVVWCMGDEPQEQTLSGKLLGSDGSLEDQDTTTMDFAPRTLNTYNLDLTPDDEGRKRVLAATPASQKSAGLLVRG